MVVPKRLNPSTCIPESISCFATVFESIPPTSTHVTAKKTHASPLLGTSWALVELVGTKQPGNRLNQKFKPVLEHVGLYLWKRSCPMKKMFPKRAAAKMTGMLDT